VPGLAGDLEDFDTGTDGIQICDCRIALKFASLCEIDFCKQHGIAGIE
jgi:hypothetical protein